MTQKGKHFLKILPGLVVTVFFVWLISRQTELASIGAALSSISPWAIAAALCFLAAGYYLRIVRWWLMLRELEPFVTKLGDIAAPPRLISFYLRHVESGDT